MVAHGIKLNDAVQYGRLEEHEWMGRMMNNGNELDSGV